jgi:hypothetical protein
MEPIITDEEYARLKESQVQRCDGSCELIGLPCICQPIELLLEDWKRMRRYEDDLINKSLIWNSSSVAS